MGGADTAVERRTGGRSGGTTVVRYAPASTTTYRPRTSGLWLPLLAVPGAAAVALLRAAAAHRRSAPALAVGLAVGVAVSGTVWPAARGAAPAQAPAASDPAASPAGAAGRAAPGDDALAALLAGRSAPVGGGTWVLQSGAARVRLQSLPMPATRAAAEVVSLARRTLQARYGTVEPLAAQYVEAILLGPEEPGTSEAAGVTAPNDPVLARRTAWAVTLRVEDPPPADAAAVRSVAAPLVELLLLDAQTLLARPPAMRLGEVDTFLRRVGRAPVSDPDRPLNFFGDPLP